MALELKSESFLDGTPIPRRYSCEGQDLSVPLGWSGAPSGTKSFALICDDPDAPVGTWVHWVVFNIPASTTKLREGVVAKEVLDDGARQGVNDFQRFGYGGPCPPGGIAHRYFFKLYALDVALSLQGRVTKEDLLAAMEGHIIDQTTLVGTYRR